MTPLANQPAFPSTNGKFIETGINMRQHYAGLAMQGLLANGEIHRVLSDVAKASKMSVQEYMAVASTEYADALIRRLEETP